MPSHPISRFLNISSHLHLGLPSALLHSGFPSKEKKTVYIQSSKRDIWHWMNQKALSVRSWARGWLNLTVPSTSSPQQQIQEFGHWLLRSCWFPIQPHIYVIYVRVIKWRRMRWAGHVVCMGEERGLYRVLVGKLEGRRPLGRPRRRWVDNIRMDLGGETGGKETTVET